MGPTTGDAVLVILVRIRKPKGVNLVCLLFTVLLGLYELRKAGDFIGNRHRCSTFFHQLAPDVGKLGIRG